MISRFELFVVLRAQVRDRALLRRALAKEAVCGALAGSVGADAELWALAGLGADIDAVLTAENPLRRGAVAEELLRAEGLPDEAAAAARACRCDAPELLSPLARGLVVADTLVDAFLAAEEPIADLTPAHLSLPLAKAARRGDPGAERALVCLGLLGLDVDAAAAAALEGLRAAAEDLA